jgi:hypothetical protein
VPCCERFVLDPTSALRDLWLRSWRAFSADGLAACVPVVRQVWEMNEEGVMKVVRKVLRADQLVHEQVLGLEWHPPEG